MPSDVIALVVQSVGGAISANSQESEGLPVGAKVTIVGLALQVTSLCVFFVLFLAIVVPNRHDIFRGKNDPFSPVVYDRPRYVEMVGGNECEPSKVDSVTGQPKPKSFVNADGGLGKLPGQSTKAFVIVLLVATVLIVIRSAYRVAELSKGLNGGLETNQWAFMIMDGLLMLIATCLLAWGHPNLLLRGNRA